MRRFDLATRAAAELINRGRIVFSPVTMTHPIDQVISPGNASLGSGYWVTFDEAFMDVCSEMIVLEVDGWKESDGIRREIQYFESQNKMIHYVKMLEGRFCFPDSISMKDDLSKTVI
jgi:hypothetical protein